MNLSEVIFKSFGLPATGKVKADQCTLTKKVDGNIDWNNDGVLDQKDKNGYVEEQELFEEVFNNRARYCKQIQDLYDAGLEDPLEEWPEIHIRARELLLRFKPKDDYEKAVLFSRALEPSSERSMYTYGEPFYYGLTYAEGGLEIPISSIGDGHLVLRQKFQGLLPKQIISAKPEERTANCVEFTSLMVSFLRESGIKAYPATYKEYSHSNVVAILNCVERKSGKYVVDASKVDITDEVPISDREFISIHYDNKACSLLTLNRKQEALKAYEIALEIDANNFAALLNKGVYLSKNGDKQGALKCYKMILEKDPKYVAAWINIGVLTEDPMEAIKIYDQALNIDPNSVDALNNKSVIFFNLQRYDEAIDCYDRIVKTAPYKIEIWLSKIAILNTFKRYGEVVECCNAALEKYRSNISAFQDNAILLLQKKAIALMNLKRYKEVIDTCVQMISLNENDDNAWSMMGEAFKYQGQECQKINMLQEALDSLNKAADCLQKAIDIRKRTIETNK